MNKFNELETFAQRQSQLNESLASYMTYSPLYLNEDRGV